MRGRCAISSPSSGAGCLVGREARGFASPPHDGFAVSLVSQSYRQVSRFLQETGPHSDDLTTTSSDTSAADTTRGSALMSSEPPEATTDQGALASKVAAPLDFARGRASARTSPHYRSCHTAGRQWGDRLGDQARVRGGSGLAATSTASKRRRREKEVDRSNRPGHSRHGKRPVSARVHEQLQRPQCVQPARHRRSRYRT